MKLAALYAKGLQTGDEELSPRHFGTFCLLPLVTKGFHKGSTKLDHRLQPRVLFTVL